MAILLAATKSRLKAADMEAEVQSRCLYNLSERPDIHWLAGVPLREKHAATAATMAAGAWLFSRGVRLCVIGLKLLLIEPFIKICTG